MQKAAHVEAYYTLIGYAPEIRRSGKDLCPARSLALLAGRNFQLLGGRGRRAWRSARRPDRAVEVINVQKAADVEAYCTLIRHAFVDSPIRRRSLLGSLEP